MKKVQYEHRSCYGTFYVDCDILSVKGGIYHTQYKDPCDGQIYKEDVPREHLIFPHFSEYIL